MNKLRNSLILAAAAALLCLPMSAAADTTVKAKLVEQNGSGVSGTVTLTALGNGGLKVVIHSQGLVPGQPHAQHIHGSAHGGHFGCPTLKKNDTDGDGVLTNEEATGEYGTVFLALTTSGGATRKTASPSTGCRWPTPRAVLTTNEPSAPRWFPRAYWSTSPHCTSCSTASTPTTTTNMTWKPWVSRHSQTAWECQTYRRKQPTRLAAASYRARAWRDRPRGGVETGGAPAPGLNAPLAAAGAALLLLSAIFAISAAARSRRHHSAGDGQTPA